MFARENEAKSLPYFLLRLKNFLSTSVWKESKLSSSLSCVTW